MLYLDPAHFIARGLDRECYRHPSDPDKCVKVAPADCAKFRAERRYCRRLARRGVDGSVMALCHGTVKTNRGHGTVFDLVRDAEGRVAPTLVHCLRQLSGRADSAWDRIDEPPSHEELREALVQLRQSMLAYRILTRDLKSENLLFRRDESGQGRIVIIDGVGTPELLPVAQLLPPIARRTVARRWRRFERRYLPPELAIDPDPTR